MEHHPEGSEGHEVMQQVSGGRQGATLGANIMGAVLWGLVVISAPAAPAPVLASGA